MVYEFRSFTIAGGASSPLCRSELEKFRRQPHINPSAIRPQLRTPRSRTRPEKSGFLNRLYQEQHLYVVSHRPFVSPIHDDCYYTGPELEGRLGVRLPFWRNPKVPWRLASVRLPNRRLALYRIGDVLDWLNRRSSGS